MVRRSAGNFEGEMLQLNQITVRVDNVDNVRSTAAIIENALSHHEPMEDVAVVVPLELLEQARTTRLMFMVFMGLVAAISLLVGGIGIMNIMLATDGGRENRNRARWALQSDIPLSLVEARAGVVGKSRILRHLPWPARVTVRSCQEILRSWFAAESL